jgi:hypothetical protein
MSFAKSLNCILLGFTLTLGTAVPHLVSAADEAPPTGEEILAMVRMSQALQDLKQLKGRLRNDDTGQEFPFLLTMSDNVIRFVFPDPPKEIINLDLRQNGTKLTRLGPGGKLEMPLALYSQPVRTTAINFEDLSMRFLYWPNAKVIGEDSISFQKCWKVRVQNPDQRGPYRLVDLWVHKESGAMMQMRAYDGKGRLMKEFKVRKAQKYNKAYILKQMRVESYNVDSNKVNGRTYLEIADPD